MAQAGTSELVDAFEQFFRSYYDNGIKQLAQRYPTEQRSLYVDWQDLYRYDPDLADDYLNKPEQLQRYAEEALRLYDLPIDVSLGQAHVRVRNLPETESPEIRDIRARHMNQLVEVRGIVRKATDVRPKIEEAAFECQLCGTLNRVPQSTGDFQEPHECQGCERQGPFQVNFDQSEFVDAQKLRIQESPEGLRGGETPQSIDVHVEDDITGEVTPGDHVSATGVLRLEQQTNQGEKSPIFDFYMEGVAVEIEEEQFEDMDITDEDKAEIVRLSESSDIYEQMIGSVAPSIYGYDQEKLAMILQLFSGVTKQLPDGSRIRGDLHMLLIGDPGTGKSQMLGYIQNIAPRSVYTSGKGSSSAGLCVTGDTLVHTENGFAEIRNVVERRLPEPVDAETAVEDEIELYTFDRDGGTLETASTSHVWRMPPKQCRRIETARGKELEASRNTPVLTCGNDGLEWKPIADVEAGEYVAAPRYDGVDRSTPPIEDYFEFTNEKLKLDDESVALIRRRLCEEFGTLRDAAAALDLTEDFLYDTVPNRHVPLDRLGRILEAIDVDLEELSIDRAMLRHGDSVRIPDEFDEDLCYLLGLVFGDGDIMLSRRGENRGHVRISNGDEAILERAVDIFDETFDKRPVIEYQDDRVPCIRVHSATIARFVSNVGMETPKAHLELDPALATAEHADAFLRGLMDADGSVSARTNGGSSIHLSTISETFARQVQLMLETYGVRARVRERDRRGVSVLENGYEIESNHVQYHLECYGTDIDRFADAIGFGCPTKQAALERVVGDAKRRGETIPVGSVLTAVDAAGGEYYMNFNRGDNPGRERARRMLEDRDLGDAESIVEEAVEADLRWDEVVAAVDTGEKEVFDLTVPETHNFLANGVVTHNTAAAVRDDFGDGQQWTLEAGALVLADQGIAAVDELDKMRCVTGDSTVSTSGGEVEIRELAHDAIAEGTVEELENGRTIRDVDRSVRTMADDGTIVERPVTAIHQYDAPSELVEVVTEDGNWVRSTPDHPFFVHENGDVTERAAADLEPGDETLAPCNQSTVVTDGGAVLVESSADSGLRDVEPREITDVRRIDGDTFEFVYDLTVEGTHNFVANGMVVHNSEDRSAMHEALEQQKISVSKAGINATLQSRCSLLGAANPKYGRFDQYEPIGEQIDLEPALISRFDLIFTVTDQPDEEKDRDLAEHILTTNYAGELTTQREEMPSLEVSAEEIEEMTDQVDPVIDAELLRKYVAYAKQNCHPRMTEEAREAIRDFYVDLRAKGTDEDAPVPVTARKLEALVRLSEASARVRLSDTVEQADAERVIEIVRSCLQDIGVDPETGEFDADIVEAGTSKSQRDRIKNLKQLISDVEEEYDDGAPTDVVLERADEVGLDRSKAEHEIEKLKQKGEVYEPSTDTLRTT
ncbi:LAGLIDADG family homing endonuclease [Natrialbaceae archaeon AArc-T1-2]|uniref:LAGLIDADG family homing endonuclease n=1 Tax=Natrialbaceae archaeon AArc-T1-2 TaxID=3053904 RepID=UPI00255A8D9B|nr:LAGLIDADG family homing endonuclease [Natrialbaceae archaeon AArc-T1-2]WIV68433.1 LAGLIDADG family homing endonuclease [Natrialbaceae archaeon AArc-T1-2]